MPTQVPDLLPPSRLTGDNATDQQIIMDFLWTYYRALRVALDSVSSLGSLATQDATVSDFELLANKDKASGYVGLSSSYQITIKNAAGTVSSTLSSVAAAARSYVLPDAAGTIALTSDLTGFELTSNKDAASGYAGLSSTYQIKLKDPTGAFVSTLSTLATAARNYTFQDGSGTVAFLSDLSGFESTSNKNAASGYAGLSATHQIQFPNNAGTFTSLFTNTNTAARTYTFQDSDGTIALVTDITGGALAGSFSSVVQSTVAAQSAAAPTIASAGTIAPTTGIVFISGVATISTITPPTPISAGGGSITLIPTGLFATDTAGNIALASAAVVGRALIMVYDATTAKWYPSY